MLKLPTMKEYAKEEMQAKIANLEETVGEAIESLSEAERFAKGIDTPDLETEILKRLRLITPASTPENREITPAGRQYGTVLYFSAPDKKQELADHFKKMVDKDQKEFECEIQKKKQVEARRKKEKARRKARKTNRK